DELTGRQHYILDTMVTEGYITSEEAKAAKAVQLEIKDRLESITAPHFVFYVRETLAERYGERLVEQGGLKIITTLDLDKQKMAEEAVTAQAEVNEKRYGATNASLVAIDVPTNQVLAMVGSRDYFNDDIAGQVNVALRPRQPGSSFKPVVYGAALALGFTPETKIFDVNTVFKTETTNYEPHNYNLKENGPVSFRRALAGSLNIPAVKVLYLTGLDRVLELAKRFGYTTLNDRSRFGLSIVLGGAEVTLLEHTATYAALAREGTTKPVVSILKVEDAQGEVLEEFKDGSGERVLEPQIVRELTSILSDNEARAFIFGAQNRLILPGRPVATKTGTTNDYHDAWTLGYTPQLAAGVWVGNSNNDEMNRGADGSVVAAPIWQNFMTRALADQPVLTFTPPEPRSTDKPVLNGQVGGEEVELDRASGLRATEFTPTSFRIKKVYGQYHTILRYVTPGDPLGPTPANPEGDAQYQTWEVAVQRWASEHGLQDEQVPVGYDNIHVPQNQPQLSITSPSQNQTVTNNPTTFNVSASAPRGISRVTYFLDGQEIGTVRTSPFSLNFSITTDWPNGYHTLSARAYDDIDNSNQTNITFNLLVTPLPPSGGAHFTNLNNGQSLSVGNLPFEVKAELDDPPNLKQVDLYLTPPNESSRWLGVVSNPSSTINFTWPQGPPGSYTLSLVLTDRSNRASPGPRVTVNVTNN
ncbi:MAG: penicillin-binding transpeptidase domain-containing protein, partial [Candidatus Veblenbacteria bacterium]|nr:penicillin-binding transpeptidase domain-containing protein [Candidatus Veblenbacteria bacterium]